MISVLPCFCPVRIVQYQAVLQLAQGAPQMYNMPLLHRQMLDVLGIKNAQKLIPMDEDQKPMDPVSENQNILMIKPVKAFAYQDHQAHIQVHMAAMQDPNIAALLQNNPSAQQIQAAMMAHINEHLGFEYRKQIELAKKVICEYQEDKRAEVLVIRQHTTRKSGYHTKERQCIAILANALEGARLILLESRTS